MDSQVAGWLACLETTPDGSARRLSLLDPGAAAPPVFAEGDTCSVLFDGALYNRSDLARALNYVPENDAALLCRAHERWGEDVLRRIRGIYALLIWDGRRQTLWAVRDAVGVRSLFYADGGPSLFLSSGIDPLVRRPEVSSALNVAALADHFCNRWPDPQETYYRAVKRVVSGHALRVSPPTRSQVLWWRPSAGEPHAGFHPEDVERFDALLDQAVARCMGEEPAAISLSGGIDSATVATVASQLSLRHGLPTPWAVSLTLNHPEGVAEAIIQKGIAEGLGLPQVLVPFKSDPGNEETLLESLATNAALQAPGSSIWNAIHTRLGIEARERGCKVLMTGNGGDEWTSVGADYSANLIRGLEIGEIYHLCRSLEYTYRGSRSRTIRDVLWKWGLRVLLHAEARRVLQAAFPERLHARWRRKAAEDVPAWVAPDPSLRAEMLQRAVRTFPTGESRWDPLVRMRESMDNPLVSMEMEELQESGDRMGIHLVHPFLDIDLVEFLWQASPRLLNLNERSKGLPRRRLEQALPHLGFGNQKKGTYVSFTASWLLNQGRQAWQAYGGTTALAELGVVDAGKLASEVGQTFADPHHHPAHLIWEALSLEAWVREHV